MAMKACSHHISEQAIQSAAHPRPAAHSFSIAFHSKVDKLSL
jgi:hypothetical protein